MGLFEKRHRNYCFAFGASGLTGFVVSSRMDFDIGIPTLVEGYSHFYYDYYYFSVKRPKIRQNALPPISEEKKANKEFCDGI